MTNNDSQKLIQNFKRKSKKPPSKIKPTHNSPSYKIFHIIFIGTLSIGLTTILLPLILKKNPPPITPNILIITSSGLSKNAISCYNKNSVIKTPNIDRICNRGVRFNNAFSQGGNQVSGLAALLIGKTNITNANSLNFNEYSLLEESDLLVNLKLTNDQQTADYFKAYVGKFPFSIDESGNTDFSQKFIRNCLERNLELSKAASDDLDTATLEDCIGGFDYFKILSGSAENDGSNYFNPVFARNKQLSEDETISSHATTGITQSAIDLFDYANTDASTKNRPYFFVINHKAPEEPWQSPTSFLTDRTNPTPFPMPNTLFEDLRTLQTTKSSNSESARNKLSKIYKNWGLKISTFHGLGNDALVLACEQSGGERIMQTADDQDNLWAEYRANGCLNDNGASPSSVCRVNTTVVPPRCNFNATQEYERLVFEDLLASDNSTWWNFYGFDTGIDSVEGVNRIFSNDLASYLGSNRKSNKPNVGRYMLFQLFMNEYKQAVESLDDSVGQILDKLEGKNQLDNTLIVLTSDHGYMLGEHGMYGSGFMYEEAIQIPLVIRYPRWTDENGKNEQFESEALVTHEDVYNLIKTLNQETLNQNIPETDIKNLLLNPNSMGSRKNFKYSFKNHCPDRASFNRANCVGWLNIPNQDGVYHFNATRDKNDELVVYEKYKLIQFKSGTGVNKEKEFFNLRNDPNEILNLVPRGGAPSNVNDNRVFGDLVGML